MNDDLIKKDEEGSSELTNITDEYFKGLVTKLTDLDSFIPSEVLQKLQKVADPKLRLDIISNFFYIKKIMEAQTYGSTLQTAVSKLNEYLKDLPFEKLLLTIDTLSKVKLTSDSDISNFLTKSKEAEAKIIEAQNSGSDSPVNVNIDNRSIEVNPIVQKIKEGMPPEVLDRILRVADSVINKGIKKNGS